MSRPSLWLGLVPVDLRPSAAPTAAGARLAAILGLSFDDLQTIRLGRRLNYRPFTVAKRGGQGERRLLAPSAPLKELQRALLVGYLDKLPVHPCATGYFRGASTVRNARPHARNGLVASVDLRDFFESTRGGRVRQFFAQQGWRGDLLRTLMTLTVFRDGLPQGAPTSPSLSNFVNAPLDDRLAALARRSGGTYTRYGDDLTFSWPTEDLPPGFTRAIEDTLGSVGYEVQPCKGWRVVAARDRPVITGVRVSGDGRLGAPIAVRARYWLARWHALTSPGGRAAARLRGYRAYLDMLADAP